MTIHDLEPKAVWENFYSLTQIPRPSKHEGKAIEFLQKFANEHCLENYKDKIGNLIVRCPATKGYENRVGVIMQGHVDMVPQNNSDTPHNWEKDPIVTRVVMKDGEPWVYATGTTLGADDGLGDAVIMTILASKDIPHGPLEALFTIDEETGMTGANNLEAGVLKGDILLNLDSETEGELYVGCAGGLDCNAEFKYKTEPMPAGYKVFEVTVGGLRGGHSGMEINEGRGNANKVMARVLVPVLKSMKGVLASIEGGNMRNAIPREAVARVGVPADKAEAFNKWVAKIDADEKAEITAIDPNVFVSCKPATAKKCMAGKVALKVMQAIYTCPNNATYMSLSIPGLVQTSNNLAIVKSEDGKDGNGVITIKTLMRSSVDSQKEDICEAIRSAFELAGGKVTMSGGYSGWRPNMDSPILKTMEKTYKKLFGKEPEVKAIHAGLECGIFQDVYKWDMISTGPTLMSPHSPDERVYAPSVPRLFQFVCETLKNIPVKK
jgi:aminoacyl-histidine dipeptidase